MELCPKTIKKNGEKWGFWGRLGFRILGKNGGNGGDGDADGGAWQYRGAGGGTVVGGEVMGGGGFGF
jgi:hypothetical protein